MSGLAIFCAAGAVWLGVAVVTALVVGRYLGRRENGPPEGEA